MDSKTGIIVEDLSKIDNIVAQLQLDASSYFLGELLHPDKEPIGIPEHAAIMMQAFGRPTFNLRRSPVKCIECSPLDINLHVYIDMIFGSCNDDIEYTYILNPYHCPFYYMVWTNILLKSTCVKYITSSNLFTTYFNMINTPSNVEPIELLSFYLYVESFRKFINNICTLFKKELTVIVESDSVVNGNIQVNNLVDIIMFFKDTEWVKLLPTKEEVLKARKAQFISETII